MYPNGGPIWGDYRDCFNRPSFMPVESHAQTQCICAIIDLYNYFHAKFDYVCSRNIG